MSFISYLARSNRDTLPPVAGLPHAFDVVGELRHMEEMKAWCEEQFGPRRDGVWDLDLFHFYFASDKDAMLFRLRW